MKIDIILKSGKVIRINNIAGTFREFISKMCKTANETTTNLQVFDNFAFVLEEVAAFSLVSEQEPQP